MKPDICSDPHKVVAILKGGNIELIDKTLACLLNTHRSYFVDCLHKYRINLSEDSKEEVWIDSILLFRKKVRLDEYNVREDANLTTYLMHLALGLAKNEKRKEDTHNERYLPIGDDSEGVERKDFQHKKKEKEIDSDLLDLFLQKLPKMCYTILTKYYFEDIMNVEIAKELGLSDVNIRVQKSKCLNSLREMIRKAGYNSSNFIN